jgi:hypothetical protein
VVTHFRVFSQAIYARAAFKAADMGIHSSVAVVATRPLGGPAATRRPVVMVAHRVSIESGTFPPCHVPAALETRAASYTLGPPAASPAAAIVFGAVLPAAVSLATRLLIESRPPLQHVRPSFLGLPQCEGRVPGQGPPGILPEEGVDEVRQDPSIEKIAINRLRSTLTNPAHRVRIRTCQTGSGSRI